MFFRKLFLWLFLVFFTLCMAGYAAVVFLFPKNVLDDLHTSVPGVKLISSFLWVVDPYLEYDPSELTKQLLVNNIHAFVSRKQQSWTWWSVNRVTSDHWNWFSLDSLPAGGKIYSPVFTFAGEVSSGANSIRFLFTWRKTYVQGAFCWWFFAWWTWVCLYGRIT